VNGVVGGSGKKFYYHNDHLGTALAITDEYGNKVVERDFAPFGEKIKTSDREEPYPDETEDGFTGKDFDEDIGLYYYNARFYDPEIGRFISEDSVSDPYSNGNLYAYCAENPVNNIDPTGHWTIPIATGLQLFSATLNALATIDPNLKEAAGAFSTFISLWNGIQNVQELFKDANRTETYEREIPAEDVGIPGVSYKEKVTVTYKNHKVVNGETVQTFINEKGDLVEITTKASAKEFEQSYTVRTKDGTYEVTENINYKAGEAGKKQTNVIAIEGFVKNKQGNAEYYGAIMVATTKQGAIGAWQGSTLSNDSSQYATIAESPLNDPYTMTKVVHHSSKYEDYNAIALEGNGKVSTEEVNPNPDSDYYNQWYANGIHIHSGFSPTSRGSHGCQTVFPGTGNYPHGGNWNSFYEAVNRNNAKDGEFIGYYYLTRMKKGVSTCIRR
ncbi:MAG: RHS repeat-associated core domain-containing protein, partial [Bacillota bacterium]